jgi:hypothetical protein
LAALGRKGFGGRAGLKRWPSGRRFAVIKKGL